MNKKIEVSKIVIKIGDKEAELTIEQAKELKDVLGELFGKDHERIYIPQPYPVYPTPYIYPRWEVTYTDNGTRTIDSGINSVSSYY